MNNTHQEGYRKHVLKHYFLYQLQKAESVHIEPSQPPYILYSPALIRPCEITFVGDLVGEKWFNPRLSVLFLDVIRTWRQNLFQHHSEHKGI